jgi:hypothetical protein
MTDIKMRECTHCEGTGEVDAEDYLDLDSIDAVRAELVNIATATGDHSLASPNRSNRILYASKIASLASRLNWLESTRMFREEWKARMDGEKRRTGETCVGCGTAASACSWSQNPGHPLTRGDCCIDCMH